MTLREHFDAHDGLWLMKIDTYFADYEPHLARFKDTNVRLLEIGVDRGGSLELYRSYFGPEAHIHGLDINPDAATSDAADATVHTGSQDDPTFLDSLVAEHGPFDIVIDDGSHLPQHQRVSFETLYPRMSDRGVYICEDVFTSYWQSYEGGLKCEGTFIEYAKDRLDDLHAFFSEDPDFAATEFTRSTRSIHIYSGAVVFERAPMTEPVCIARQGGGEASMSAMKLRNDGA